MKQSELIVFMDKSVQLPEIIPCATKPCPTFPLQTSRKA